MLFFNLQGSSATGNLSIQLKTYKNSESKTSDGSCCDYSGWWSKTCAATCDPYFIFKFDTETEKSNTFGSTSYKIFSDVSNNRVHFQFARWEVCHDNVPTLNNNQWEQFFCVN